MQKLPILLLRRPEVFAIINTKNKNAAACGCYQHPQAYAGAISTYTTALSGRTAFVLYDNLFSLARVVLSL